VFVKTLKEVELVLDAFIGAASSGELDAAIAQATQREPRLKPRAAKASANA